ncbi:MAG: hypothetical protein HY909_29780 [Deltaproteobacteria bacterium]|nr:hypothetical protein [Deltaproteobacteria bacterium]
MSSRWRITSRPRGASITAECTLALALLGPGACARESPLARRHRELSAALQRSPVVAECWRRSVSRAPEHPPEELRVSITVDTRGHVLSTRVTGARDYRLVPCLRAELPTVDLGEGPAATVEVPLRLLRAPGGGRSPGAPR